MKKKKGAISTFFSKVKEELEFIPARVNVIEYWQEKAVFKPVSDTHLRAHETKANLVSGRLIERKNAATVSEAGGLGVIASAVLYP